MNNEKQIDEILAEVKIRLMKENEPVNGVWYKYTDERDAKVKFTDVVNREGYGFSQDNSFVTGQCSVDNLTPMSQSEISEMLKNHAIKLGFKSGVKVDRSNINPVNMCYSKIVNILDYNFEYDVEVDCLRIGKYLIYQQGIWADIVTEKTSQEWIEGYYKSDYGLERFIKINNLELKQKK